MCMRGFAVAVTFAGAALVFSPSAVQADPAESGHGFEAVAEIFENSCIRCHSSYGTMQGDMSLARYDDVFGAEAPGVIRPGEPGRSRLVQMVSGPEPRMPKHSSPLSDEQVQIIRDWIADGAEWTDRDRILQDLGVPDANWWSFEPIDPVALPELSAEDAEWVRQPIDAFVIDKLREEGLSPSPEADRRTLIRRVYYDLTGLPPTYEQVEAFVNDPDPEAYEKLVDELLASPSYGERWARHWLDMAGYGDTQGFDKDSLRENAYHYRDYVIRSFNEGKPYEQFVREQVAGDVLYPDRSEGIIATGFIVAGPWDQVGHTELREGTMDKKVTRVLDRDEMVDTVIGGLTSLTVDCARCHTHKFDAISHEDYYQMQAIFAGIERANRPFPARPELIDEKEALEAQIAAIETQLAEFDTADRPEVVGLREEIAALTADAAGLGHASHGWHSDIHNDRDAPAWVQVDLGESVELAYVVLAPTYDDFANIGAGFGFPARFKVEISDDPDFEQDVVVIDDRTRQDVSNPGVTPWVVDVGGQSARYVRMTATRRAERQGDYIFALGELAALTAEGENVARGQAVRASHSIEQGERWGAANLVNGIYPAMGDDGDILPELAEAGAEYQRLLDDLLDEDARRQRHALHEQLDALHAELDQMPSPYEMTFAAARDFEPWARFTPPPDGKPRPIHILDRGEVSQPLEEVGPGALAAMDHLEHHFDAIDDLSDEGQRRAALAEWLVDKENPLTWRSIANRIWHHHFGAGIVASLDDFGRMGQEPTHPELLDWLAGEFRDGPQSFKDLHRMIVISATYRQESRVRSDMAAVDTGNRYLWRMHSRRLEAEAVRDTVLAVTGVLDREMYGPGFKAFGFVDDHSPHYHYHEHDVDDPEALRRSIYRFIVRSVPDPFMEVLDCADPQDNVHVRDTTLTALQALTMMNNPLMVRQAEHLADRVRRKADNLEDQINHAFRLVLARDAEPEEIDDLVLVAAEHGMENVTRLLLNSNEMMFVD